MINKAENTSHQGKDLEKDKTFQSELINSDQIG